MTDEKKSKFTFRLDRWKIKIVKRSKGRMKFQIKLSKEEADAFSNFSNSVKPLEISMEDFTRSIFFAGIRSLEEQLTTNIVQHMEDNREEYETSGFTFDTSGKLTGVVDGSGSVEVFE